MTDAAMKIAAAKAAAAKKGRTQSSGSTKTVRPVQASAKKTSKKSETKGTRGPRISYTDAQLSQGVAYIKSHSDDKDLVIQRELYFGKNMPIACIRAAFAKVNNSPYRSIGIWAANEDAQKKAWKEGNK